MAIPSVNNFSNQPGGGLVTALDGINALSNAMLNTQINRIKKEFAPLTSRAEAASKLAYANLMGPQFLAKLLNNPDALANLSESEKKNILNTVQGAGAGLSGLNALNQMPGGEGIGHHATNALSGWIKDKFKNIFGQGVNQNSIQPNPNSIDQMPQLPEPEGNGPARNEPQVGDAVSEDYDPEFHRAYADWQNSPEGRAELAKGENADIPTRKEVIERFNNKNGIPIEEIEAKEEEPTWAEKTGRSAGIKKEGEEAGTIRAKDVGEIGRDQLQLSKTGLSLDKLIGDFTNPKFVALRAEFPYLQDMQLEAASHLKDPRIQHLIGKIKADIESFKGQTVQSFGGQTLKREFDYADQLKPNTNDTVYTALGKASALKSLQEIAYKKNNIIKDLIQKKHMSLADAVEKANHMIDIKSIEKRVNELTEPMIRLRDPDTGVKIMVTKARAKELGFNND